MKKLLLAVAVLILSAGPALGQYIPVSGYVSQGGTTVTVGGLPPTVATYLKTFPGATVTVYATGTSNLVSIYSNSSGSAKANPFTSDSVTSLWIFWVAPGIYDIRFSGTGITVPWTVSTGVQVTGIGNSTTVIDASLVFGATWGDRVIAAAAAGTCPTVGCTIDTRGLTGVQVIPSLITLPPSTHLILGDAQIQCLTIPCISYTHSDIIEGQGGLSLSAACPQGSIIWGNVTSPAGAMITPVSGAYQVNMHDFALVDSGNACASVSGNTTHIGIDFSQVLNSQFRNINFVGFDKGLYANHVGGCDCYNHIENVNFLALNQDGLYLGADANWNVVLNVQSNFVPAKSNVVHLDGATGNDIVGVKCENGDVTALCVNVTSISGTSADNNILGIVSATGFATPQWSDTSGSVASFGIGNTIQVSNRFVEVNGRFTTGDEGITASVNNINLGPLSSSIGTTTLYTDPVGGNSSSYIINYTLYATTGSTGNVQATFTWGNGFYNQVCTSPVLNITTNNGFEGTRAVSGGTIQYSTTYVASGNYYLYATVTKQ
jgi:hypothetical protein